MRFYFAYADDFFNILIIKKMYTIDVILLWPLFKHVLSKYLLHNFPSNCNYNVAANWRKSDKVTFSIALFIHNH